MNRMIVNPSLGYNPLNYPNGMSYHDWCDTLGKYRWYHEDGTSRTQYALDYSWKEIYDIACKTADIAFGYYHINNPEMFTSDFLSMVPVNWLKYKTELEMFSGSLDGKTIDPDMFSAGFERTTRGYNNNDYGNTNTYRGTGTNTNETSDTGKQIDDNKQRSINYNQGVQAYGNLSDIEIGDAGNDYASNFNDTIATLDRTTSNESESNSSNIVNSTDTNTGNSDTDYYENVKETRISFYDNLAFLRDRLDRLKLLTPFHYYFRPLFISVESIRGDW